MSNISYDILIFCKITLTLMTVNQINASVKLNIPLVICPTLMFW